MSVLEAVERDLAEIRRVAPDLPDSTLAAAALELARRMDDPRNSTTSVSMCAKTLSEIVGQLRALTPAKKERDDLDDARQRRAKRLAGGAGT